MNRKGKSYLFRTVNVVFLAFLAALCLLPLIHIAAVSFSDQAAVSANQVGLFPKGFTLASYKMVAKRGAFWKAFGVSVNRVILGVAINTVVTVLMAYPLSKSEREFPFRRVYVWLLIFVMIFDGGLVPNYLLVHNLKLFDTIWALVLPAAVPIYNIILTMNFMKQLPGTIEEAAMVDGAGYFQRFVYLVIPLSKPVMAVVCLYYAVAHWNDYYTALIYISNRELVPLQTVLREVLMSAASIAESMHNASESAAMLMQQKQELAQSLKYTSIIAGIVPMMIAYPFVQKYFVKGVMVGAIKG